MRRGSDGLVRQVQPVLGHDPPSGHLFVFCSRRGDLLKVLFCDGLGLCLCAKRLERGRFVFYGLCRWFGHASPPVRTAVAPMITIRTAEDAGLIDGHSDSYAGVSYPMMTVRRRSASLWPQTRA